MTCTKPKITLSLSCIVRDINCVLCFSFAKIITVLACKLYYSVTRQLQYELQWTIHITVAVHVVFCNIMLYSFLKKRYWQSFDLLSRFSFSAIITTYVCDCNIIRVLFLYDNLHIIFTEIHYISWRLILIVIKY